MLFRNFTPFVPLQFESRDAERKDFGVVVLRGTFAIEAGRPLRPIPQQAPIVMADEYHGAPGQSSLKVEGNLAQYKPKTDVHVNAVAYPPDGRPAKEWTVGLRAGDLNTELTVTGPRYWTSRGLNSWQLSDPAPIPNLPVRYEFAYGGKISDEIVCEENPVGIGFFDPKTVARDKPLPAPQILPKGYQIQSFGQTIPVAGLGPIAPAWRPRRDRAGTFDLAWEKSRWPDLPSDFSFEFYNSAAAGLTAPGFLKGDEVFTLTNLTPGGSLGFQLPGYELATILRMVDGRLIPTPCQLDTVHIDPSESKAYLVWRALFPIDKPIRVLEVRMRTPADIRAQATYPAGRY